MDQAFSGIRRVQVVAYDGSVAPDVDALPLQRLAREAGDRALQPTAPLSGAVGIGEAGDAGVETIPAGEQRLMFGPFWAAK